MSNQPSQTSEQIARNQRVTLLELLDRLIDRGVMVKGEILLSVADVELVYLNLGLLLSSVKTVEHAANRSGRREAEIIPLPIPPREESIHLLRLEEKSNDLVSTPLAKEISASSNSDGTTVDGTLSSAIGDELNKLSQPKTDIDHENVEKGLVKLVLTLVDLIRKLMEKQAIRRIEANQLNDREIEAVGNTFLLLDEKMNQLKANFDLKDEDLNLDLGPLGELV
ncbi:hypothetical protein KSF_035610 [Reticulibacter mediterranei]|uniref:Gas vesicle structural protein n=1 Tax=Reticulibacter mediterranei TaxID=2778369 RepID=A0A8J3IH29_9CHLR|nr:gas vesicle protein GvpJ [Reticulibacter mediterranei]GHO93513.1 hypothetical protein KSF_035610 [Reticulibacter mediterranei]